MSVEDGHGDTDNQTSVKPGNGEWITPAVSYVDPSRRFCELCGRPIARRFWHVAIAGTHRKFCDPAHAELFTTYPRRPDLTE